MSTELRCTKPVKIKGKKQLCNALANEYEVTGNTYTARAVFCVKHMLMAVNEGFTVKAVEEAKTDARFSTDRKYRYWLLN